MFLRCFGFDEAPYLASRCPFVPPKTEGAASRRPLRADLPPPPPRAASVAGLVPPGHRLAGRVDERAAERAAL